MNTLVIVTGSGRCGTTSLSHVLSMQGVTNVSHERYGHKVRWNCPSALWPFRLWNDTLASSNEFVGDSAFYWTPHIGYFLQLAEKYNRPVKVVGLVRPRDEVIASYSNWKRGRNNWTYHNGNKWEYDDWDHCYPSFENCTREEAIGRFWDRAYSILQEHAIESEHVSLFETRELNSKIGVNAILNHIGIREEDKVIEEAVVKNRGPEYAR